MSPISGQTSLPPFSFTKRVPTIPGMKTTGSFGPRTVKSLPDPEAENGTQGDERPVVASTTRAAQW